MKHTSQSREKIREASLKRYAKRKIYKFSCETCQKFTIVNPSKAKRNKRFFCSRECRAIWMSKYSHFVGSKNPNWAGGEVTVHCRCCGKNYRVRKYTVNRTKYCSQSCSAKVRFSGEKNPNWKGGVSEYRDHVKSSQPYKLWRAKVFKRDYWTCQDCGYKGNDIEAHHIKRWTDNPRLTFKVWNGITLCKKCHDKTYGKEEQFEKRYLKKTLNDYMLGSSNRTMKIESGLHGDMQK